MLTLITGKPGSGKTLNLLYDLENERKAEAAEAAKDPEKTVRPIYYHGIPELKLEGWIYCEDPTAWAKLPPGSKLVVDEAQKFFPVREKGKAPDFVTELSTHRHLGIDIYFITQDPMLVDVWLRRLVGRHRHCVSPWGLNVTMMYDWQQVTDINDPGARKQALSTRRPHPKKFYDVYKSADLHTPKGRPPWSKIIVLVALVAILIGLIVFVARLVTGFGSDQQADALSAIAPGQQQDTLSGSRTRSRSPYSSQPHDLEQLSATFRPAAPALPWSAPFFDRMVEPKVMPVVMGCGHIKTDRIDRCTCTDQTGANVPTTRAQCLNWLRNQEPDWSGERERILAINRAEIDSRQGSGGMSRSSDAAPGARAPGTTASSSSSAGSGAMPSMF